MRIKWVNVGTGLCLKNEVEIWDSHWLDKRMSLTPRVTYLILDVIWFFTYNYSFYLPKFNSIQFNPNSKPKATNPWTLVVRKGGRWQREREADLDCRCVDPPFQMTSLPTSSIHRPGTARFFCLAIFLLILNSGACYLLLSHIWLLWDEEFSPKEEFM